MDDPPREPRRRTPQPLDGAGLERLALHYVGRYATTRAKLSAYLARKLKERGWAGDDAPPVEALVGRMAEAGYVDDRVFAETRDAALRRRGYGARRIAQAMQAAGIDADDRPPPAEEDEALAAALAFARRRRIGPYARAPGDDATARRATAALIRAGHDFTVVRRVMAMSPERIE